MSGTSSDVNLEIEYTDTKGERKTIEKIVNLNFGTSIDLNTSTPRMASNGVDGKTRGGAMGGMDNGVSKLITWAKWFGIVVLIAIAGIVSYKFYKKKKLKNNKKKN